MARLPRHTGGICRGIKAQHALFGAPWSLTNQNGQALFFYLATSGQAFTRDYLAALHWGDAAVRNARHSLRSSLYKLREALRRLCYTVCDGTAA
jgi:DNA-binding SARP family transcriptional activator